MRSNSVTTDALKEMGYTHITVLPDGRICGIYRLMFTWGLMVGLDATGYSGRYCYSDYQEAVGALNEWDGTGDPTGPWIVYKGEPFSRINTQQE